MKKYSYRKKKDSRMKSVKTRAAGISKVIKKGKYAKKKIREIPIPISRKFMDFLSFKKIFVIWVCFIFLFGFIYFSLNLASPENGLIGFDLTSVTDSLFNSMYFSFIAATATGFGDILPIGLSRTISVIEILCSMIIFAIVISKLVSFKQEAILNEIYEISLDEKVNRMRSALYLSRSDFSRMTDKISEGRSPKTITENLWSNMHTLHEVMVDIRRSICSKKSSKSGFIKSVDDFHVELILNSIMLTLGKLNELLYQMDSVSYNWRSGKNLDGIRSVISVIDSIHDYYVVSKIPTSMSKRLEELKSVKNDIENRL